jgi:pilus assembly protein TadC
MNNQVEYLREKQMMEVKAQINKIPNKVSIISVIFIIPLILLIILGPFIIELL